MKETGPLPMLVGGTLVVAALCTLLVRGGWLVWMPVLLALVVLTCIWEAIRQQ